MTSLVKGEASLYLNKVIRAALVVVTRINQPRSLDKSVVMKPEIKPTSLVSTSALGFGLVMGARVSQESRGCQAHP